MCGVDSKVGFVRMNDSNPTGKDAAPSGHHLSFPVVGVGASAGGLEAFTEFIDALDDKLGLAVVLILHLPPQHESAVADILSRHTAMPVQEVAHGMQVQVNHVYVIKPGHTLTLDQGSFKLGEQVEKPGHGRPVDDFFKSLAEEQKEQAICILMSGMGSNGTAGAQSVKGYGGLCIAQDPDSAKFSSMPRHLIDSGHVDFILRPVDMPQVLKGYINHLPVAGRHVTQAVLKQEQQHLHDIFAILRTRTKQDFSGYKKPTVLRRVERRMNLNRVTKISEYVQVLRESPTEVATLAEDLLIHVTGFFRDPDA